MKAIHDRVVEHNLRVVAGYYTQVESKHLASMLNLTVDDLETFVSKLVGNDTIFAKIDRPAGIICFVRPKPAEEILSDWAGLTFLSCLFISYHPIHLSRVV
jgi:26S proteasome regulatory subunit N5